MTTDPKKFPLLSRIDEPAQLHQLTDQELLALSIELREFLLQTLNDCGGHLGANLGTIELTVALHAVFNAPHDQFVWDVGHQAYPHKILTGRRDLLHTIRQHNGLAPFLKREESIYDSFGVGHSSTSISAALGMAVASKLDNIPRKCVAIIGDGAMTAGMAFEALNHAGHLHADLLVILNDNDMSISHNVGALSNYFARLLTGHTYTRLREGSKKVLSLMPTPLWEIAKRTEAHVKGIVTSGSVFEELGFNYIGPVDGHDLPMLLKTLRNLHTLNGPQFLHVVTRKGKGYDPAELDPIAYHAVSPGFYTHDTPSTKSKNLTYSNIFGQWLCDMAALDDRLVAITPAMREGSDLVKFSEQFPQRYFDVAIAEQHSVTFAAGLACMGKKPIVAIYSTFLQRAYDQVIHDVAIQNLPVVFAIDRAGLVGGDGPTHAGSFDLTYMRCLPNMIVMAPADENECRQMLYTAFLQNGPTAVRYPRGTGPGVTVETIMSALPIGKAEIRRRGKKIVLLAFGSMLTPSLAISDQLNATVVNMRFVKPLDEKLIKEIAHTHECLITLEENTIAGGAGSAVNEYLATQHITIPILNIGLPDAFIEHGTPQEMLARCQLDAKGILCTINHFLASIDMAISPSSVYSS